MSFHEHFDALKQMYHTAPINAFYQARLELQPNASTIEVNVREEFFHAAKSLHGCVYFKMLDDAAFFAVQSTLTDVFVYTVEFKVHLLRPVTEGMLVSRGNVRFRSQSLAVGEAVVECNGKEVGTGSGTFVKSRVSLNSKIGYHALQ